MASRLAARQPAPPPRSLHELNNYDIDDDPFAESGDEAAQTNGPSDTQSKKRKETSGLGIDEEVSVSKKPRVPRVKLDEARLLSENGIPKLRSKARNLKFKGKGHEVRIWRVGVSILSSQSGYSSRMPLDSCLSINYG
jgi:replication fork protection complex subunit Csm3/Swi3